MKRVMMMLAAVVMTVAAAEQPAQKPSHDYTNPRLCKLFRQKIVDYQKQMRDDDYAKATLASYKKRAAMFCGTNEKK